MVDLGQLDALTLSGSKVVGSREGAWELPGSAAYIDAEEFRSRGYTNVNRILAAVPGVYLREEDGYGNFPNISMRGASGTRSEKITLMEDGILSAPAAYSGPSAYYSPRASRMAGIEILKGSSQIKYGPQTTAGVVNYLSTPIPLGAEDGSPNFYWRSTYGSDNTFFNHAYYGNTVETSNGTFGYLFELFAEETDGFRKLDGGKDTGFSIYEPMVKLFWEPDTALKQRFEFKFGSTELDADETYVGLSPADFAASPYRRYAGTQFDNMSTDHTRTYFKWIAEPSEDFSFEAAVYYNDFHRNWTKIGGVDVTDPADVAVLNGTAPGVLNLTAAPRDYESYGIQFSALYEFETGSVEHDLEFGARWHQDDARRKQRADTITSTGTGPSGFTVAQGVPGSAGNRYESAEALSLWMTDEIDFGKLAISPGFRYEHIDLHNTDYLSDPTDTVDVIRNGSESYFAPGMGFTYDFDENNKLFGGVFKGYSIAGPRSILRDGVEKEESLGYEIGARHRSKGVTAELVAFLTDYDNLIATDAGFDPILNPNRNVGEAEVYGLEALISYDAGRENGLGYGVPMYLSATWTSAELKTAVAAGGGGMYDGGVDGSNIPYVPEWQIATGIGVAFDKWGANLDLTYRSTSYGTANNFDVPITDQKQGKIESVLLLDLSAYYQLQENLKLVGGIQNLTDEEYVSSRMPLGARAGAPRQLFAGFEASF